MEKLEMKITLTRDTVPRLLAYLDALPGPRARALVVKLLAERALESGINPLGPAPLLPAAAPTTTRTPTSPKATSKKMSTGLASKRRVASPTPKGRPASRGGRAAK